MKILSASFFDMLMNHMCSFFQALTASIIMLLAGCRQTASAKSADNGDISSDKGGVALKFDDGSIRRVDFYADNIFRVFQDGYRQWFFCDFKTDTGMFRQDERTHDGEKSEKRQNCVG